jgi:hypothetical protein
MSAECPGERAIQALAAALPQLLASMPEVQAREWFEQAGVLPQLSSTAKKAGQDEAHRYGRS